LHNPQILKIAYVSLFLKRIPHLLPSFLHTHTQRFGCHIIGHINIWASLYLSISMDLTTYLKFVSSSFGSASADWEDEGKRSLLFNYVVKISPFSGEGEQPMVSLEFVVWSLVLIT